MEGNGQFYKLQRPSSSSQALGPLKWLEVQHVSK
jgi:hypothetical protein